MVKTTEQKIISNVGRMRSPEITKQRMIDDVIENFDFERCRHTMNLLGWRWVGVGIPTVEDLKILATERIENAIKGILDKDNRLSCHSYYYSSSGGLKATAWKNRYGHLESIKLEFVLTEWDSDGDE